ncbi:MAG TPA: hypothetical protein PLX69_23990 [Leptospiraceae bacterium]|nr:hypothetical protein [Leptospiraceae bacterium]HRG77642.1 hypothetical protein [Leptospiraceae bacterium]
MGYKLVNVKMDVEFFEEGGKQIKNIILTDDPAANSLSFTDGLAVDSSGGLYIVDSRSRVLYWQHNGIEGIWTKW